MFRLPVGAIASLVHSQASRQPHPSPTNHPGNLPMSSPRRSKLAGYRLVRETQLTSHYAESQKVDSPAAVMALMAPIAVLEPTEVLWILPLTTQHTLRRNGWITISRGILNSSLVHPREVFRAAIAANAASIILVHNHPSGDPSPSQDDILVTRGLARAGKVLGIAVLDHIIIGDGTYYSLAEHQRMDS